MCIRDRYGAARVVKYTQIIMASGLLAIFFAASISWLAVILTVSYTHLESKDYRFKFDMNDVYNTLGMSSQTFWNAGYSSEYYIWDAGTFTEALSMPPKYCWMAF